MFSSKKGNIILSLLVAIALWVYVVGEIDPSVTQTYNGVTITFINEDSILENDMAVLSQSAETIDVTLTGKRSVMNQIDATDIAATVDLTDALEGENEFKINVKAPDKTEIVDRSLNNITVVVEESISEEKDVEVYYDGTFAEDTEPTTVEMNIETVTVTGAKSLVESIDHVKATVTSDQVKESLKTVTSSLVAVNKKGNEIRNVRLSSDKAVISTVLSKIKTVPLKVDVTDSEADEVERDFSAPKTIVIKGKADALDKITEIEAESIDISNITEDTEIDIVPILPDGVTISEKTSDLIVTVTATSYQSKSFTIASDDITLSGLGDELTATVDSGNVVATITGTKAQLESIAAGDIKLSADLSGLAAGTHQVDIKAACSKAHSKLTTDIAKIKVVIE